MMKHLLTTLMVAMGVLYTSPMAAQTMDGDMLVAERLSRGAIAVPTSDSGNGMLVSWRLLGTDDKSITFDVVRDGKTIATDISDRTNYEDTEGTANCKYEIVAKVGGKTVSTAEASSWTSICMQIPLNRPAGGKTRSGDEYTYSPNDCTVADVDGDGNYEIILKWDPSNSQDNSKSGYTGNVLIDCYKLDGTQLWRIDMGKNIRAGAHYTQMLAYDFDGDGKGELIVKTAPGTLDGAGNYVSYAATDEEIRNVDNTKDWRITSGSNIGKINGGQEWLTVFNGESGDAIHTIFYNPNRATGYGGEAEWTFNWDIRSGKKDYEYGNRGERYLATVAYLDGMDQRPSAVMCRGYYTYAFLWAVDFDGKELKHKWLHYSKSTTQYDLTDADWNTTTYTNNKPTGKEKGSATAFANGNHNLSCGDVDGDGCDEIIYGASAIDQDGKLLYATGFGHGDAMHMSDLVPSRPGLEVFTVHEESPYGWNVHDAATGEILFSAEGGSDNGRGMSADVIADSEGFEFSSSNDRQQRSATTGKVVSEAKSSVNFRVYWDGDLQDELLDGAALTKWDGSSFSTLNVWPKYALSTIHNPQSCNSTKKTPNLVADILGDWREEIILWDGDDYSHLNVYSTCTPSPYRVPTLMHDHVYRLAVAWQNVAYNQPPHLGYYLPTNVTATGISKVQADNLESLVGLDNAADLSIYNIGGARLKSLSAGESLADAIASLPKGVYLVKAVASDGKTKTVKVTR